MRRFLLVLVVLWSVAVGGTQVPPLQVPLGEMVGGIACVSDPTQTYTLYIPTAFTGDRRWPVLLVFDPRGRSLLAAELFREAAEDYGWIIVSSDNTRSDGPMEPNILALQALWPEIHTRLPADPERIYAAGFSGGAAVAYLLAQSTGEVAGIVACGGRMLRESLAGVEAPIFSTAGDTDFNYGEMHAVDEHLADRGIPHRLVIFDGPHTWMPRAVAREAVDWLELLAMRRGLRPVDSGLVDALYRENLAAAETARAAGRFIEAARRCREMGETYSGLRDTAEVTRRARQIEASAEHRRERKERKRWDAFEREYLEDMNRQLYELRNAEIAPPARQLALALRVDELRRRTANDGYEGVVARRALNALSTGLAFYLPRDFMAAGQYDRLAVALELALEISDDNPVAWYNLACSRARLGRGNLAMEALARAIENGFTRPELLATDSDLDSLREREDFRKLLESASGEIK